MSTIAHPKNTNWSFFEKLGFRFFFSYFALYILFNNNGAYPFFQIISGWYNKYLHSFIPWIGKTFLGISREIPVVITGSGDTTYDYILVFSMGIVAALSSILWTFLDRKSDHYLKMYYWLSLAIRMYVGLMLINYGMVKIIQLQFSAPSLYRLTQNFGDASPMGLAWTFLGFSKGYNIFMGIAEIAAVLLLFRRTMAFGLIITLMTTANVMAVNYFYDVPVKLLSTHLFLMAAFLFARDFSNVWQFFFFRKPVALSSIYRPNFKKGFKIFLLSFKILLLVYVLGFGFFNTLASKARYANPNADAPLKGLFEVEEVSINNGKENAKIETHIKDWKYILVNSPKYATIRTYKNNTQSFTFGADTISKKVVLSSLNGSSNEEYHFTYTEDLNNIFYFKGTIKNDSISLKLKRTINYKDKFLLTNRGFHWINEVPFNR